MPKPQPADRGRGWARPGTLLVPGFLALVAVLAVTAWMAARDEGRPAATPAAAPSTSDGVSSAETNAAGPGPGRAALSTTVPTSPPARVRWELYGTVPLPYSAAAGPSSVRGDVATGYAHDPVGALVASQQLSARKLLAADWRAVALAGLAPGAGRDAWLALRARYGTLASPPPGQLAQTAGFRFVDYDPGRAVIQTVSRFPSGALQVTTSTVVWSGTDWQLVLQPDGSDSPTAQPVTSLAGFVAWGGV